MFGPGVSTMPSETRAKPSREDRWGMGDSRLGDTGLLARILSRCHFVLGVVVGRIFHGMSAGLTSMPRCHRPACPGDPVLTDGIYEATHQTRLAVYKSAINCDDSKPLMRLVPIVGGPGIDMQRQRQQHR